MWQLSQPRVSLASLIVGSRLHSDRETLGRELSLVFQKLRNDLTGVLFLFRLRRTKRAYPPLQFVGNCVGSNTSLNLFALPGFVDGLNFRLRQRPVEELHFIDHAIERARGTEVAERSRRRADGPRY